MTEFESMQLVDRCGERIRELTADDPARATAATDAVRTIEQAIRGAIDVWQTFLESGRESDDSFTAVMWLGAEPSRALFAYHQAAKEGARRLTEATGLPFSDTMGIHSAVDVVMAYEARREGESMTDRAKRAIETMRERLETLRAATKG